MRGGTSSSTCAASPTVETDTTASAGSGTVTSPAVLGVIGGPASKGRPRTVVHTCRGRFDTAAAAAAAESSLKVTLGGDFTPVTSCHAFSCIHYHQRPYHIAIPLLMSLFCSYSTARHACGYLTTHCFLTTIVKSFWSGETNVTNGAPSLSRPEPWPTGSIVQPISTSCVI